MYRIYTTRLTAAKLHATGGGGQKGSNWKRHLLDTAAPFNLQERSSFAKFQDRNCARTMNLQCTKMIDPLMHYKYTFFRQLAYFWIFRFVIVDGLYNGLHKTHSLATRTWGDIMLAHMVSRLLPTVRCCWNRVQPLPSWLRESGNEADIVSGACYCVEFVVFDCLGLWDCPRLLYQLNFTVAQNAGSWPPSNALPIWRPACDILQSFTSSTQWRNHRYLAIWSGSFVSLAESRKLPFRDCTWLFPPPPPQIVYLWSVITNILIK